MQLLQLDPQLIASMQQNAASVANSLAAQVNPNDALNSGAFYQQLLAQMQQQQQNSQPPSLPISPPASSQPNQPTAISTNDLIQQLLVVSLF